jgi:PAS domain S-box-containing protein
MTSAIQVLHVDDESSFGDLVADFLEREEDRFDVVTETGAADGLERVEQNTPDCIVSDFQMPGKDGIEFLESVREEYPDLPFILFTGKGSEEVASDAISSGATDYLQKGSGTDQYKLLANRVTNAVEQHQSKRELQRERSRMEFALKSTDAAIWTRDIETDEMEIHPTICPIFGTTIESLDEWVEEIHPQDRDRAEEVIRSAARESESYSIQFRFPGKEGVRWGKMNGQTIVEDGQASFQTGITRDITTQKERKRRFETLTSNLPGMVYRCKNEPEWPMEDVRGNVEEFSGYTALELESNETQWGGEVIHPDDREDVWETVQESLKTSDSFELTYRIETTDGETRWVWERGRGVFGPDNELDALEGFITDITERRRREKELRRNERRFESMFNDPNILVALLETDGTVQHINDTALEYVEADREDIVDESFWETPWWTKDTTADLKTWIDLAADGEYVEYEVDHAMSDRNVFTVEGTFRPVTNDKGAVVSLIASARDITERKQREAELEKVRDQMEFALARTRSVIWELDHETGEIVSYPDHCPVLDGSVETIEEFTNRVYDEDRPVVSEAVESVFETRESETIEFRTIPDVETEWVEAQIQPVFDDGSVSRSIGVCKDITDYKRRQQQLERQNERFDELASVVSHDLQTPIQTIEGRLELAAETGETAHIEDAVDSVGRLNELREDLVTMLRAKEIVGEMEEVDIGDLAESAWETVDSSDGSTLEIVETVRMECDSGATRRLLQNLFSNSVEHAECSTTIHVGSLGEGFYVEDDGPGIDPEDREKVFTPGFSTKSGGSGMGMASVRQIVEEHGWEIDIVEPETLDGVRFEVLE